MCTTASWIETHSSYCIAWENSTFWNNVAAGMWRWRLSGTCCGPGPRLVLSTALQLITFCWLLASSQGFWSLVRLSTNGSLRAMCLWPGIIATNCLWLFSAWVRFCQFCGLREWGGCRPNWNWLWLQPGDRHWQLETELRMWLCDFHSGARLLPVLLEPFFLARSPLSPRWLHVVGRVICRYDWTCFISKKKKRKD